MKINLKQYKDFNLSDTEILELFGTDTEEMRKYIIIDTNKTSKILKTISGPNISCTIGMGKSHRVVFNGNTALTIIE